MVPGWVTFDCYGTLVDWHAGYLRLLSGPCGARAAEVIAAYHRFERELESARPHRSYREVLTTAVAQAAAAVGLPMSPEDASVLAAGWGSLPIFADVEPMLEELRTSGWRLGVLTNCDDDLFAETQRNFRKPFDRVITAQRVGAYKPASAHFEQFARETGVGREDWVHVACSWFHDMQTTRSLGVRRVWLDRDRTGEDPASVSARVETTLDVVRVIRGWSAAR